MVIVVILIAIAVAQVVTKRRLNELKQRTEESDVLR